MAAQGRLLSRTLLVVAVGCALVALTAAAVAGAQSPAGWQRLGGSAPGGDDLAVIDGVPHVAWTDSSGVHVARLDTASGPWHPVGSAFRHAPGADGALAGASLASDPTGRPWVAWTEVDVHEVAQVRVARFDGTAWREVVGGVHPLNPPPYQPDDYVANSGFLPQLTFYEGVPYVGWVQDELGEVQTYGARLKSDGSAWETIGRPGDSDGHVRLVVSGGRLYLAWRSFPNATPEIRRLNPAGTDWDVIVDPHPGPALDGRFRDIADVQGVLHVVYGGDSEQLVRLLPDGSFEPVGGPLPGGGPPGARPRFVADRWSSLAADGTVPYWARVAGESPNRTVDVRRYTGGAWQPLSPPSSSPGEAGSVQLEPAHSGGMWMLYSVVSGGSNTWRLAGYGATLPEPEEPSNPGGEPEPRPTGHCAHAVRGTAGRDVLRGSVRSDSISGFAGRDRLFGYRGNDCLFGGAGPDYLSAGPGADLLVGGAGADVLRGGDGDDDLNGNSGKDRIFGGRGHDAIDAGSGNDRVDVRGGGADLANCGSGRDTVLVDPRDGTRGCERILVRR